MPAVLALLLVLALAAMGGAALRWSRALGAHGLDAVLAAAPLAAATAGASGLALGLAGLGGSPLALTGVAVAVFGMTRWRDAAPVARPLWRAAADAAGRLTPGHRAVLGAVIGAGAAWTAWVLRHPGLAVDPLSYHLPESILWVQQGAPGTVERLQYDFPQGDYPVTNELLVAWLMGIARSSGPALLWTPAMALLAVLAGWRALRGMGGTRLLSGLAIAAVLLAPIAASQLIGPHTDLPAIAWLWTAGALLVAAEHRPRLLAPALVAAALAVGTKTTVAPLVVLLAVVAVARHRRRLRRLAPLLAVAAVPAVAAGGVWYLRNLLLHGSPLYPFRAAPWGDPVPEFLRRLDVSFLQRPGTTLERHGATHLRTLAGGLPLLVLGLGAPLLCRRRGVVAAAAVTALALLTWLAAPFTGAADDPVLDVSATTTRYLLPTLSAAAVAAVLAGRRRAAAGVAVAVLAAACAWSVAATQDLPVLAMPGTATLLAGALAGGLAGRFARLTGSSDLRPPLAAGLAAVLALTVVLAGSSFARRQAGTGFQASDGVVAWAASRPAWERQGFPIAFAPQMLAPLAGDRLQHRIELVPRQATCRAVHARARAGWVVLGTFPFAEKRAPFSAAGCLVTTPPEVRVLYRDRYFTVFGRHA